MADSIFRLLKIPTFQLLFFDVECRKISFSQYSFSEHRKRIASFYTAVHTEVCAFRVRRVNIRVMSAYETGMTITKCARALEGHLGIK